MIEAGSTATVRIEKLVNRGAGLARIDGQVGFVEMVAPGDLVQIEVTRLQGKIWFGKSTRLLERSALRTEPPCRWFGECGGCDWQHLDYAAQLEAKRQILEEQITRGSGFEIPGDFRIEPALVPYGYRTRAEWHVDKATGKIGFFERGSHRICEVSTCLALAPHLDQARASIQNALQKMPQRPDQLTAVTNGVELSTWPPGTKIGEQEIEIVVAGERYFFDARCFTQSNLEMTGTLVDEALWLARQQGPVELAWDLFCGFGLFTVPLARLYHHTVGVDSSRQSIGYARRNLNAAEMPRVKAIAASVEEWVGSLGADNHPDLVLVDPPRTGVPKEALARLAEFQPKCFTYVSCDPATLARDLKLLKEAGYRLERVALIDMIPQTHHIEAVAHLTR